MDVDRLIAHRGDNTNYPENSYAGIEAALKAGAKYVEFDLQMNADKTLIVFHDDDFVRMANKDRSVFETSNAALKEISVHEPDKFSKQHYPTRVPHLDEVIKLFKAYPEAKALVEVKVQSLEFWGLETVMKKLLASLEAISKQAIVISYSAEALRYTQENSRMKVGLVFNQYLKKHLKAGIKIDPEYMICPYKIVPEKTLWKGDWQWVIYTINKEKDAKAWLNREDIDYIETDDISLLLNAVND